MDPQKAEFGLKSAGQIGGVLDKKSSAIDANVQAKWDISAEDTVGTPIPRRGSMIPRQPSAPTSLLHTIKPSLRQDQRVAPLHSSAEGLAAIDRGSQKKPCDTWLVVSPHVFFCLCWLLSALFTAFTSHGSVRLVLTTVSPLGSDRAQSVGK